MPDLIMQIVGGLVIAAVAFAIGWHARGTRAVQSGEEAVEWQVLDITYHDDTRTRELNRFLWSSRYKTYEEAMRQAKRLEGEDTLKNRFNHEYLAVKAP